MSQTVRLRPDHGGKASTITRMLHPSFFITENRTETWKRDRVEGLVLVEQDIWVVRRGSPVTNTFIMRHENFPNKELYDTKRMVHLTEEVQQ